MPAFGDEVVAWVGEVVFGGNLTDLAPRDGTVVPRDSALDSSVCVESCPNSGFAQDSGRGPVVRVTGFKYSL